MADQRVFSLRLCFLPWRSSTTEPCGSIHQFIESQTIGSVGLFITGTASTLPRPLTSPSDRFHSYLLHQPLNASVPFGLCSHATELFFMTCKRTQCYAEATQIHVPLHDSTTATSPLVLDSTVFQMNATSVLGDTVHAP